MRTATNPSTVWENGKRNPERNRDVIAKPVDVVVAT
jgi:hypothetical protein